MSVPTWRGLAAGYAAAVLVIPVALCERLVAHCLAALPHEGCGLLVGDPSTATVTDAIGTRNVAASALFYEVDPAEHLAVERAAEAAGRDVIGAFHSHTHTDAWPSATDVARAADPTWHWLIVSLRMAEPVVRSFRIESERISEEEISLVEE